MWQRHLQREDQHRAGVRFTLPHLTAHKGLLTSRPQLQRNKVLKLDEEIVCILGEDISRIPAAVSSTMRHLGFRHTEVSTWQAQMSESIGLIDREISAVELLKDTTEHCLQEKQLYAQLMSDCVALSNILNPATLRQDRVLVELKREEQLTNEIKALLQKQICILLDKLSCLKETRSQLLADYRDKSEAIRLTTKCIADDVSNSSSRLPASQYRPNHVSYDKWLRHCNDLRMLADNQIRDSSIFRGNLRFTLANMKNALERQHVSSNNGLRKKINDLSKYQDTLNWERQRVNDEISDLTSDIQKICGQMRNCDSKLHQATHSLDILNQRPRHELCLDRPHFSLTLEKHDLTKMSAGLHPVLMSSQQELEATRRRLMIVEDKLAKNAQALEVERKCQNLHQSYLPSLDCKVVLLSKPKLRCTPGHASAHKYMQY